MLENVVFLDRTETTNVVDTRIDDTTLIINCDKMDDKLHTVSKKLKCMIKCIVRHKDG